MKFDCAKCTPVQKRHRGCQQKPIEPILLDGEQLLRCPLKLVSLATIEYIRLFKFYQKGFLPCAGGILEQPAKLLDIFLILEDEIDKIEKEQEDARPNARPV